MLGCFLTLISLGQLDFCSLEKSMSLVTGTLMSSGVFT